MKRHLLLITLALLLAVSVNAQSIGVYWDEAGTVNEIPGLAPSFTGYVIIFAEDAVRGASYGLQINPANGVGGASHVFFASATYPEGLQIGDPFAAGIDVAFTDVVYGFGSTPVIVSTLTFVNISGGVAHGQIDVIPPTSGNVEYANGTAELYPLAYETNAVANEDMTFGGVKNLFR